MDAELSLGLQPLLPQTTTSSMCWTTARCAKSSSTSAPPSTSTCWKRLIGKLANRLMQLPGVKGVRVKIAKLEIFADCEVAIRVETGQWNKD